MRASRLIFSILGLGFTLLNWVSLNTATSPKALAQESSTNSSCIPVGRLIKVQGQIRLKRQSWSNYHPTTVGAELCLNDLLQPAKGATAIVQCADPEQKIWTATDIFLSGAAIGCRPPSDLIHNLAEPIVPTREPLTNNIPHIIAPSNTWLLSNEPKLRWTAVPGTTVYVVRVTGRGVDWRSEAHTTSITYPGHPPLQPTPEGYLLTVEAENGQTTRSSFGLLDKNKANQIKTAVARLNKYDLSSDAKNLARAELYIGQGLIAEAIELLETSAANKSQIPAIYYTLGNLYSHLQLFHLAIPNYLKAVKLANAALDPDAEAIAAARLAEVYQAMGFDDQAAYWSKLAQQKYQTLKS